MNIYREEPRFDTLTGELDDPVKVVDHVRCDLTGAVVSRKAGTAGEPTFVLDYKSSDPCFGCLGDEHEFGREHDIDVRIFLAGDYHVAFHGGHDDIADALAVTFSKLAMLEPGEQCLSTFLRSSRVATAKNLISLNAVTAEQLDAGEGW